MPCFRSLLSIIAMSHQLLLSSCWMPYIMVDIHLSSVHRCLAFPGSQVSRICCVDLRTLLCCDVSLLLAHYYCNVSPAAIIFLLNDIYHGQCTLLCLHFCLLLPMSLYILSIFELSSGHETQTLWPNSTTQFTHHHVYNTTLQCKDPAAQLHIELHELITGNVTLHPNGTLCFLIAKAFIPLTGSIKIPIQPVLFKSQALILFPGNANQPDYDDNIPLDTHFCIWHCLWHCFQQHQWVHGVPHASSRICEGRVKNVCDRVCLHILSYFFND